MVRVVQETARPKGSWHQAALRGLLFFSGLVLAACATSVALYAYAMHRAVQRIHEKQDAILHHTSHAALLAACRESIASFSGVRRPPGDENITLPGDDARLPSQLRRLEATYVMIAPDSVHVELGGGFLHYGLEAVAASAPEDFKKYLDSLPGRKRLVDGLWYYEDQ